MLRPLTELIRDDRPPLDLEAFRSAGGYRGFERALTELSPAEIIDVVSRSRLRGRGGAGFPTGKSWRSCSRPNSTWSASVRRGPPSRATSCCARWSGRTASTKG